MSKTAAAALAVTTTLLLAACGGSGDAPPAGPEIASFAAERGSYAMGERARLVPVFSGGSGHIEGVGAVRSGVAVETAALDGDRSYRLVVEAPGRAPAVGTATVAADHRNRYTVAGTFAASLHSAQELPDGSVLIIGGSRGASVLSAAIDRYDPATRSFAQVAQLAGGRALAQPVLLADGRVLVTGGLTALASGVAYEVYDPATGQLAAAGEPVRHRVGHTATRLRDGRVFIAGGIEDATAEIWDPATGAARPVAARMAHGRQSHTATLLADGQVLLVGGYTVSAVYRFAELFDPATEQFTPLGDPRIAPANENLGLHYAHRRADGSVLIAGGERYIPDVDEDGRPTAAVLRFDPATRRFDALPALLEPRSFVAAVALADDRVLLFGGAGGGLVPKASAEVYRTGARSGGPAAPLPAPRVFHTVSRLPGGRVLIVGGEDPAGGYADEVLVYE